MGRLTLKLKKPTKNGFKYLGVTGAKAQEVLNKLGEFEDLEEQGKLVLYPTYAYCIIGNEVRKGFVFEVTYCVCRKPLYTVRYDNNSLDKHTGYLGLSVFLTKEEAEEKLKELNT